MPKSTVFPDVITFSWGDGDKLRFTADEWHEYYRLAMKLRPEALQELPNWRIESRPLSNWMPLKDDEETVLTVEELGDFLYAAGNAATHSARTPLRQSSSNNRGGQRLSVWAGEWNTHRDRGESKGKS